MNTLNIVSFVLAIIFILIFGAIWIIGDVFLFHKAAKIAMKNRLNNEFLEMTGLSPRLGSGYKLYQHFKKYENNQQNS